MRRAAREERPETGRSGPSIRVGMVGSGFMARAHSLAYRNLASVYWPSIPRVELVRLADVTQELADAGAARFGWSDATADWRDVTRASDIDLVDIVAPNHVHAEIAIDAAEHRKHVVCEKPLAPDPDSAAAMYEAATKAGVVHHVGFVYRKWPAVQFASRLIDTGAIGRILHFRAHYLHDYALDPSLPMSWRFERGKAGAGSIADIGSHILDIARLLVGDVERVLARSHTFVTARPAAGNGAESSFRRVEQRNGGSALEPVDVDDASDVIIEFPDGPIGVIQTNWMAAGHNNDLSFEVGGERGSIQFSWHHASELRFFSTDDGEAVRGYRTIVMGPVHPNAEAFWPVPGIHMGYADAFLVSLREVVDAVVAGRSVSPDFGDGLRVCEIVEAVQRSADTGEWVDVRRRTKRGVPTVENGVGLRKEWEK